MRRSMVQRWALAALLLPTLSAISALRAAPAIADATPDATPAAAPTAAPAAAPPAPPPHFWLNILDPQRQASEQLMRRGALAFKREHFVSALRAFEEAASRSPHLTAAHLFAGLAAERLKQHALAIQHFEAFRDATPDADASHDVCFQLAIAASHLGLWPKTISEYERCLAASPPSSPRRIIYLGNLAETYMAIGRLDDAIRTYEAALAIDPTLLHALLGLGVALTRAQQPNRAAPLLRLGLLQDPALEEMTGDDVFFIPPGDGYFHLGLMLDTLHRVEDARRYYQKFLDHLPNSPYRATAEARLDALSRRRDPLLKTLPSPNARVTTAAVDPTLSWLAIGTAQGQLSLLHLGTLSVTLGPSDGPRVIDLAFSPDGAELRALLADGTLLRLDPHHKLKPLAPPAPLGPPADPASARRALSLSADASAAVIFQAPNTLEIWRDLDRASPPPPALITSPTSDILMASAPSRAGDALFLVRGPLGQRLPLSPTSDPLTSTPPTVGITDAELSPTSPLAAAATLKGVALFSLTDGLPLHLLLPHGDPTVQALTIDPSGRYLITVSSSTIQLWDLSALPTP